MFGKKKTIDIPAPGSMMWDFKLGDRVKDKINGLEGIAVNRVYHLSGCDRFGIEPDATDGKSGETFHVDGMRLELVTSFPERHRDEIPRGGIFLGDQARDLVHGISGTVTLINVPLHGALQYDISPPYDTKTKTMPTGYFIDEHLVEVTKPITPVAVEAVATPDPAIPAEAPKPKPRGAMRHGLGMR